MLTMMLSQATSYFIVFLFTFMFVLVDIGLQYLGVYVNKWYLDAIDKSKREQRRKDLKSKTVIKRKITTYESKFYYSPSNLIIFYLDRGFAFSGEAGNDRLLMESVSNRISQALLNNIQKAAFGITFNTNNKEQEQQNFKVQ